MRENSGVVLSTDGVQGKNVELSMGASALSNKTYHFDKVFSPAADQAMIFDDVVTPLLDEVWSHFPRFVLSNLTSMDRCCKAITAQSSLMGKREPVRHTQCPATCQKTHLGSCRMRQE